MRTTHGEQAFCPLVSPTPVRVPDRAWSTGTVELPRRRSRGVAVHRVSRSVYGVSAAPAVGAGACVPSPRRYPALPVGPLHAQAQTPLRAEVIHHPTDSRKRHGQTPRTLSGANGAGYGRRSVRVITRSSGGRSAEGAVGREGLFALGPGVPVVAPVGAAIGTHWIGRGRRVQCGLDPLVMLGVLQKVFRGNAVPGRERVASQPVVTIRNLAGRSPYLDARAAITFERLVWTAAASSLRPTAMAAGTSGRFRSVVHVGSCYSCWVLRMKSACVVRARGTCIWQNTSRSEVRRAVQQQFGQHRYEDQLGVLYMKMRSVDGNNRSGGLSPSNPETAQSGRDGGPRGPGCS